MDVTEVATKSNQYGIELKCSICSHTFTTSRNLKQQMESHSDEKQHKCSICEYKCKQLDNLKRHLRSHTNEKLYACTVCNFKTAVSSNLKQHYAYPYKREAIQMFNLQF